MANCGRPSPARPPGFSTKSAAVAVTVYRQQLIRVELTAIGGPLADTLTAGCDQQTDYNTARGQGAPITIGVPTPSETARPAGLDRSVSTQFMGVA